MANLSTSILIIIQFTMFSPSWSKIKTNSVPQCLLDRFYIGWNYFQLKKKNTSINSINNYKNYIEWPVVKREITRQWQCELDYNNHGGGNGQFMEGIFGVDRWNKCRGWLMIMMRGWINEEWWGPRTPYLYLLIKYTLF